MPGIRARVAQRWPDNGLVGAVFTDAADPLNLSYRILKKERRRLSWRSRRRSDGTRRVDTRADVKEYPPIDAMIKRQPAGPRLAGFPGVVALRQGA